MNHAVLKEIRFTLHNVINSTQQIVKNSIKDAFEGENMQTQYTVLNYRIETTLFS